MPPVRRLTAILAADVASYSRMMGVDEEGTHERLQAHFRELVGPKIKEHRGRIVKNTGDGLLAEFASVVDAVRCAVEVQRGMADREPDVPEDRRIRFRIGINLGDVIVAEDDIFGDGVNVAARLEALAEPGGVLVSNTVYEHVRDRLPFTFDDLGEHQVKNIVRPVRVYVLRPESKAELPTAGLRIAVPRRRRSVLAPIAAGVAAVLVIVVIGWWAWSPTRSSSTTPAAVAATTSVAQPLVAPRLSIVVLPFANLSNDPDQQYFADGITEDLTTDLSRIAHMFVISRDSAFTYKNKAANAKQIGRELGVRYVLEGSVQRSGNQARINAQLIEAESDTHLWAERFDRDIGDLFALQDEITGRIASTLNLELIAAEANQPVEHPDALDYIFRGREFFFGKSRSLQNWRTAIGWYEQALAADPQSAEAKTYLAGALVDEVRVFRPNSSMADLARAEKLIDEALATSAAKTSWAHYVKGALLRVKGQWQDAIDEFEAALALNHNNTAALQGVGWCKISIGSIDEVLPLAEKAIRIGPRDPGIGFLYMMIGDVHELQAQPQEAIVWFEKARVTISTVPQLRIRLTSAYALAGDPERAAGELAEARKLAGDDRYSSVAHLKAIGNWGVPKTRALFEATFFAGLRLAGLPEE
jgi:TolB-like protein/class 3 adenylate cyclase